MQESFGGLSNLNRDGKEGGAKSVREGARQKVSYY